MPCNVGLILNKQEYPSIADLADFMIVAMPGGGIEEARYLQTLHDTLVTARMQKVGITPEVMAEKERKLLDRLKLLAGGRP
jgi:hypothetical protein